MPRGYTFSMKKITHTKEKRQPKINTGMNGKGLTVNVGLLPVFLTVRSAALETTTTLHHFCNSHSGCCEYIILSER